MLFPKEALQSEAAVQQTEVKLNANLAVAKSDQRTRVGEGAVADEPAERIGTCKLDVN